MPIITLTTDFGVGSPYVAQMKASILGIDAGAAILDVTHGIGPQNVREGAVVLDDTTRRFPPGSIHVAVIDPGVGTEREILYARIGQQHYIAPDNGLLSLLAQHEAPQRLVALTNPRYWLLEVSRTFHGRDIMAPAAAHLSLGLDPRELGEEREKFQMLDWPQPQVGERKIVGEVLYIDSFGNLISNITAELLASAGAAEESMKVWLGDRELKQFVRSYGEAAANEAVALLGSSGRLEAAVVNGSAAERLGGAVGQPMTVRW